MTYSSRLQKLHLWIPELFEHKSGIQVYSEFLLKAIQNIFPQVNYELFLKHDTGNLINSIFLPHTNFNFAGTIPLALRTPVFAGQLLGKGLWQRPDLVLASHINFTPAAYWLKRVTKISYWAVAHGKDAWNIENPNLQNALCHADRIIAVSNYTRNRLLKEQNLDPQKISLLPNTFDSNRFQIKPKPQHLLRRYNLNTDSQIILTVSRLDIQQVCKGYDVILRALPKIRVHIPKVHYILVGKGKDRFRIEQLINKLGLQDCVTLTGFVSDTELPDYYNLCDLFAMIGTTEGFGIVYLEALATGKPVIGGNQDGAIDALCNGELGALVNPQNLDEIVNTIVQILQGAYYKNIVYQPENLRQKVIDLYGFNNYQQTLSQLFEQYLL